jgi:hypothetical protein
VIAELAALGHNVEQCYRVLNVSHAGYYDWRCRAPSARQIRHAWLTDVIAQVHRDSFGAYGSPRVRAELVPGKGITIGRGTVALLMARAGLQGLPNGRRLYRPSGLATASDLVDRQFSRSEPDQLWVTDITEHPTREGKLFCSTSTLAGSWAGESLLAMTPPLRPTPWGWPSRAAARSWRDHT